MAKQVLTPMPDYAKLLSPFPDYAELARPFRSLSTAAGLAETVRVG